MKKLLLLACIFSLASCTITRKINFELNKETDASMLAFLDRNNVDYKKEDLATLNSAYAYGLFSNNGYLQVPEAHFFNRDGYRVNNNFRGTNCGQVIKNAEKINTAPISDKKENLNTFAENFDFMAVPNESQIQYDAYVVISWGIFADKDVHEANETAFKWYKSLKEDYPDMKIKVILLNIDLQEKWHLTKEQEEILGVAKKSS